jgi:hypothetical protein
MESACGVVRHRAAGRGCRVQLLWRGRSVGSVGFLSNGRWWFGEIALRATNPVRGV